MPRTFDQVKRGHVIRIGAGKQRHVVLSNNRGVITAVKQNVYSKSTISVTKSQKKKITYHGKRKVTKSMSAVHARDPITLTQSRGGYKNPYAKKRK